MKMHLPMIITFTIVLPLMYLLVNPQPNVPTAICVGLAPIAALLFVGGFGGRRRR